MARGQTDSIGAEQRVDTIYLLILQGHRIPHIVQKSSKKWGVSERQVYYYVRRAQTLIREQAERVRQEAFDEHLMARRLLRKLAHDANDERLAFDILKDEARLLGLYAAEQ